MKTIKATTKKGQSFIRSYEYSSYRSIHDAYKNPSGAKIRAYNHCCQCCEEENGWGMKITGSSCHVFTASWQTAKGLRVETANNSYLITD